MNDNVQAYIALIEMARIIGSDLMDLITNHAHTHLTASEFDALEAAFAADAARADANRHAE